MAEKISGIYKIINTVTGDFYIGSSKNVKSRWKDHKCKSTWKNCPNNPMYLDMQKYGVDKFAFEILAEDEADKLKEVEQEFIETLKPTYNSNNANGLNIERRKEYQKEYQKTDKYKDYQKEYQKTDKYKDYQKEYQKEYQKSDKCKEYMKEYYKEYYSQFCYYNGETLTLAALSMRFSKAGIEHSTKEAKKYLVL